MCEKKCSIFCKNHSFYIVEHVMYYSPVTSITVIRCLHHFHGMSLWDDTHRACVITSTPHWKCSWIPAVYGSHPYLVSFPFYAIPTLISQKFLFICIGLLHTLFLYLREFVHMIFQIFCVIIYLFFLSKWPSVLVER